MNSALRDSVESALAELGHPSKSIRNARPLGGGCISQVYRLELEDETQLLLKSNSSVPDDFFAREIEGLNALAEVQRIRVLNPILNGYCESSNAHFFLVEYVETGQARDGFWKQFGQQLAEMHLAGKGGRYGFDSDNYLGSTRQFNSWDDDWIRFFATRRIGDQVALAKERGNATNELQDRAARFIDELPTWLEPAIEPPTLIHGDLWSGNYLIDTQNQAVLIDPAVYYGHREAELAMTKLFGGFPSEFFAAYHETWPLLDGWEQRLEIYKLYHLLNHLNLFGTSYLSSCVEILRKFASN